MQDKVFLREESLISSFLWHDIHVIAEWPSPIDDGGIVYVTVHIGVVVILRFLVRIIQYGIVVIGLHKRYVVYALLSKKQKQDQTQKTWTTTHPHSRCLVIPFYETSNVHEYRERLHVLRRNPSATKLWNVL